MVKLDVEKVNSRIDKIISSEEAVNNPRPYGNQSAIDCHRKGSGLVKAQID